MRKWMGYIPAVLFTGFYLFEGMIGSTFTLPVLFVLLACLWISALLLHKGSFWGGFLGLLPAMIIIVMGWLRTGQTIRTEILIGIALFLFYAGFGILYTYA